MILGDGTVIPHYLGLASRGDSSGGSFLTDNSLRTGQIKKVIYPDDSESYGKKTVEYEVEVEYRDGSGTATSSIYRGCTVSTMFGGTADRFHATLRPDSTGQESEGVGSKVLLLCLSGDQQKAIILGGIEDHNDRVESKDAGHNLFFEFNGLQFTIDKDGQARLTHKGPTDHSGAISEEAKSGTYFELDKDGSAKVATPSDAQFVKIDHSTKTIEVQADSAWNVTVNGATTLASRGNSTIETQAELHLNSAANTIIKSAGVLTGDATDATLLGTTFRSNHVAMHNVTSLAFEALGASLSEAANSLDSAIPLNAIPVIGGALASPALAKASTTLKLAAASAKGIGEAIKLFEANGPMTSLKNRSD